MNGVKLLFAMWNNKNREHKIIIILSYKIAKIYLFNYKDLIMNYFSKNKSF